MVHFVYSILIAWIFGIIHQNIQKDSFKNEVSTNFYTWPTPSKALGDQPRKRRWGKDGPYSSFATKCWCRTTYDLNVEAIFFCNWVRPAQPADLIFLTSTLLMGALPLPDLTVSASFWVSFLFAWQRLCQGQETCTQPVTLVHINLPTVTKKL